jgi:anti-anti-sigma regulatory factor
MSSAEQGQPQEFSEQPSGSQRRRFDGLPLYPDQYRNRNTIVLEDAFIGLRQKGVREVVVYLEDTETTSFDSMTVGLLAGVLKRARELDKKLFLPKLPDEIRGELERSGLAGIEPLEFTNPTKESG